MPAAFRGVARGSTGLPPPNLALNCVREDQTRLEFGTRAVAAWRCCLAPRRASARRTATRRGADDMPTTPGRWHWRLHPGAKRAVARATLASREGSRGPIDAEGEVKYANTMRGPWYINSMGTGTCSECTRKQRHRGDGARKTGRGTPLRGGRRDRPRGRERTPLVSALTLRGCGALPLRTDCGIVVVLYTVVDVPWYS
jgi:hypothetical protein